MTRNVSLSYMEDVMLRGQLVTILISTPDGLTTIKTLDFETSNFDINGDGVDEVTPFKDKELIIVGLRALVDAGVTLDFVQVDDAAVIGNKVYTANSILNTLKLVAAEGFKWDAREKGPAATDGNSPVLSDTLGGGPGIMARKNIGVKASVSGGNNIDLFVTAWVIPRRD